MTPRRSRHREQPLQQTTGLLVAMGGRHDQSGANACSHLWTNAQYSFLYSFLSNQFETVQKRGCLAAFAKIAVGVIVLFVGIAWLSSGRERAPDRPAQPKIVPAKFPYEIVERKPAFWGQILKVRIRERLSEFDLRELAEAIHQSSAIPSEATSMLFYLPKMRIEEPHWAIVKVEARNNVSELIVVGATRDTALKLQKIAQADARNVIACWIAETVGVPMTTIYEEDGKFFQESTYADGSSGNVRELLRSEQAGLVIFHDRAPQHEADKDVYYALDIERRQIEHRDAKYIIEVGNLIQDTAAGGRSAKIVTEQHQESVGNLDQFIDTVDMQVTGEHVQAESDVASNDAKGGGAADEKAKRRAGSRIALTTQLIQGGKAGEPEAKWMRAVIADFPDTELATQAAELLKQIPQ